MFSVVNAMACCTATSDMSIRYECDAWISSRVGDGGRVGRGGVVSVVPGVIFQGDAIPETAVEATLAGMSLIGVL